VRELIETTLVDDPPALAARAGSRATALDPEIDETQAISRSGKQVIAEMESASVRAPASRR
jgi:hypothetical protein